MNKAHASETEPPSPFFMCLFLMASFYLMYMMRENFDFDILNVPFLVGDFPCRPSNGFTLHNLLCNLESAV